jgi:hypothetical protein
MQGPDVQWIVFQTRFPSFLNSACQVPHTFFGNSNDPFKTKHSEKSQTRRRWFHQLQGAENSAIDATRATHNALHSRGIAAQEVHTAMPGVSMRCHNPAASCPGLNYGSITYVVWTKTAMTPSCSWRYRHDAMGHTAHVRSGVSPCSVGTSSIWKRAPLHIPTARCRLSPHDFRQQRW